ncbi:MAG TPA: NADH:ubiquinone oxidoreductase [Euryarchaeota archaeon]|nr:NADH:ubiquinone oxidoreductase [Euryarchaeota archaeon]
MANQLPRVGIYGLTGCAGDQLTIINCEDEILALFGAADIRSFVMAKSDNTEDEMDVAFVEGSVSTEEDLSMLKDIRKRSKILIAIGGCASCGGPQSGRALEKNWKDRIKQVYGNTKFEIPDAKEHQPLSAHVKVDGVIPGCPIDKGEFLRAVSRIVNGDMPIAYKYPVCVECKYNENECLLLKGIPCIGPLTAAGCDSVCVNHNIPCVGCRGPVIEANVASEYKLLLEKKFSKEDIVNRAMMFGGVKMAELLENLKGAKK